MSKKDSDAIRTFICIELPEQLKKQIESLETRLREVDAQVSWVRPGNVHLTIKFLGGVSSRKLDRVITVVEQAGARSEPFEVEVGGCGCFPSRGNPRVLWVGLTRIPEALRKLYDSTEEGLEREGFAPEKRKFSPHLTIGRLRSPRNGELLAQRLAELGFDPQRFTAREIIVMRSDLKPTGSVYTPQFVAPLGRSPKPAGCE
jgi:2'-5' RNA ligase